MRCCFLFVFFLLSHLCALAQQLRPKWVDDLRGTGNTNNVTAIALDPQNNVYITGQFKGTVDFDPSAGVKNLTSEGIDDIFVGKYTQDGTLIWVESIGGIGDEKPFGLAVDKDGNVSIVGYFLSATLDADPGPGIFNLTNPNPSNNTNGFLIHLDTNGGFLWANAFDLVGSYIYGGGVALRVATDSQDNVVTTSEFSGSLIIGDSTYSAPQGADPDGLITKYGPGGNVLWSVHLHGTGDPINEGVEPYVSIDSHDNVLVSGDFIGTTNFNPLGSAYLLSAPAGYTSTFVAKYSPSGTLIWINNITHLLNGFGFYPVAICTDQQDNVYISKSFFGTLYFGSVSLTATPLNPYQCIAKYSSAGILEFAKEITVGQGDFFVPLYFDLAGDNNGHIFLTGGFRGTINFNMNTGIAENLTAHGSQDFFVAKYDANGNSLYAFNCGPPATSYCSSTDSYSIAIDNENNVDIGGAFCTTVNFDPTGCSTDTSTAVPTNQFEGFFAQYGTITIANNILTPPIPNSYCTNSTPAAITASLPTGGNGTYTYQWLSSADSVTFADITGATAQNYTPLTISATTYYERMVSSDTCTTPTVSNIIGLHVLPALAAPVVTVAATTSSSVIFTWTAVPGAKGYQVSTDGGQTFTAVSGLTDTISNLQPGESITINVQAAGSIACQLSASDTATGSVPSSDVVFVANAFTPNGDGRNDVLHVKGDNIQSLKFSIYDQWGELLFSSTNTQNGWDGTYKGSKEPVGVYVYYLDATLNNGSSIKKKGSITLLK